MKRSELLKYVALLTLLIALASISGQAWDDYVFIESARLLLQGKDPYAYSDSIKAYVVGLGPMWVTYPPLPLLLWALSISPLVLLKVPLSYLYLLFIKLPSIVSILFSITIAKRMNANWKILLLNPIVITSIFIHGMFDSIVAFFLLLALYFLISGKVEYGGIAYGLALSTKQHAILALLPILFYIYRKFESLRMILRFGLMALGTFVLIILLYSSIFGFSNLEALFRSIFLFHSHRPPNSLGFGGFAVLNFYSDALSGFTGNTAVALSMGSVVELYKVIDKASLLFIPSYLILSIIIRDPFEGVLLAYLVYILLSYVGAVQHLVVPAVLYTFAYQSSPLLRRYSKLLMYAFILYSIQHILSFWDLFPMVVNPLFLKSFGLWLAKVSRIIDYVFEYWDVVLRIIGSISLSLAFISLVSFIVMYFKDHRRYASYLVIGSYILELIILIALAPSLTHHNEMNGNEIVEAKGWCLIVPWENMEYPGQMYGDYMSKFAVPIYGYYSFSKPIADKLVHELKGKCNIGILARLDLFRGYEYTDLISSLIQNKVKYAWVLSPNNYIDGVGSTSPNSFKRLLEVIRVNTPVNGYFKLGGILDILNETLGLFKDITYYDGYYKYNGKPLLLILGNLSTRELEIIEKYGFAIDRFNGTIINIRDMELSIS
ncbi:hypothetical protein EYM_07590 [Ignicoccus islandicus DSM 13165]|uniref:DUF2029 domain-containing protein n=1 Tax=Ignicoccus islandicus DSM 13165 TaxID=940295 RepID=A0A0U3FLQ8_9CREN|nr:hypothetical protein [Ignicoccus islandicus]ALU12790.1 hypothetical protein EYM_07590 [Ignicoccus islandicus DSM 13165]